MSRDLAHLDAGELIAGYRARSFSPHDVVDAVARRIKAVDPGVGAFVTLCLDRAREEAVAAERAYARGDAGPLAGVPFAAKDLLDSAGVRTTYGSSMFASHVPDADAVAVARTRAAGAILVGKSNTHEFAWGITTVNPHTGTTRNPWAPDRVAGGSSGGSAAALATHQVPLALGSDTGGSIRIPAAFCGVVGLKPTIGRVSAAGCFPLAPTLDHVGPMARTPRDAALLLAAIAGVDEPPGEPVAGLRVGVCRDLHPVALSPAVQAAHDAAAAALADLGARVDEVPFPAAGLVGDTFAAIQLAEALHVHSERGLFPDRADEYGPDVRRRIELAGAIDLPRYLAAQADRERLRAGFGELFERVDVLLTPVAGGSPVPIGAHRSEHLGGEIAFRDLVMGFTMPQNLAGLPACSLRAGFDEHGIPVGVQLTGPPWSERRILAVTDALFTATAPLQDRWPE